MSRTVRLLDHEGTLAVDWSIAELARASGVTSRTLRHYDAIGLLPPAWTADNGWRYYEREQLLRLQQILLLRNLGLPLDTIGELLALAGDSEAIDVLSKHREWLLAEQKRLGRLVHTVESTIENLRKGGEMSPKQVFEGFEQKHWEAEVRERWGDQAVDAVNRRIEGWTDSDADQARTGYTRVREGLAPLKAAGVPVDDSRVQELVALHHQTVSLFWTPGAAAYRGLGEMYVGDERFHDEVGGGDRALVEYLRDAIVVYADTTLAE
ncbi:MAG: MerR family transcriptional regulator [Pseudonocardia sp.]